MVMQLIAYIISLYLRNWLKTAQDLCSAEEAKEFLLDTLEVEITVLENLLSGKEQRTGFCHNDLQYGNIMIDEVTRQLTIIVSSFLYYILVYRLF